MKGLYLYCIRAKNGPKVPVKSINGGKVFTIPYQDLEAVVSEVTLDEFGSEEIQKRAQEDLVWIKEKALVHEKIIEEAGIAAVIPMKFGTIFKTKEKLEEIFKKYYFKFQKTLEGLTGKQEWSVKVYLNRKVFEEEIKKFSPVVEEKEKEIARMPEGAAYFMQKQIDEIVQGEAEKILKNYTENFFENLKDFAVLEAKGKILGKELTGKSLPMILNAVFLISEERLDDFAEEVKGLNKKYKSKGFNFEHSGPWPPYHFV